MRRTGSRRANLKHTTVDLHVEGEDVTADVSEYTSVDEDCPERRGVFCPNLSMSPKLAARRATAGAMVSGANPVNPNRRLERGGDTV